jgi:hypothetical protein
MTARDATPVLREPRVAVGPRPRPRWRNVRDCCFIAKQQCIRGIALTGMKI